MKRRFAVHHRRQQDACAEASLSFQGYETFRPLARNRSGRRIRAADSLSPGYFFVHPDNSAENGAPIRSTRGVQDLARLVGLRPAAVTQLFTADIPRRADPATGFADLAGTTDYQPNPIVRVTEGTLVGYEASSESWLVGGPQTAGR